MGYRGYTESMEVLIDILDELRSINAKLAVHPVAEVKKEEKVTDDANKQERSGVRGTNRSRGTVADNAGQRE